MRITRARLARAVRHPRRSLRLAVNRVRRVRRPNTPGRRPAHGWLPYLLVVLAAAASLAGLAVRPATRAPQHAVDYVIVAGAAGLRWDDLDPVRTPALWQEAAKGSVGWLSVKSAHRTTCPADGWLTLGAGNYAAWDTEPVETACPAAMPDFTRPDAIGANLTDQRTVVQENQERLPYGAVPGALAESVRCSTAVGDGAVVAAARPFGRVDQYSPALPQNPATLLASCVISVVDLGAITGTGAARQSAVEQADATLSRIVAARPPNSLIMVAGVSDTDTTSRLHVALAEGPGWDGGWLTSAGTGRQGYLQLVDLAPTVLSALARPSPDKLFAGRTATVVPGKPADLAAAVGGDHDADRRAGAQEQVGTWFYTVLAGVLIVLFLLAIPLMVSARRHAGPTGPKRPRRRFVAVMEVLLVAAALAIPAALVADAVPWWRSSRPGLLFGLVTLVVIGIGTALVRFAPRWRRALWPMGAVAAIGAVVVGLDLLTGAQLQLNGVAGYSTLQGSRYSGVGGVGLGVFVSGTLVVAGCLAQWVRRPWRPVIVVLVGGFSVIMVGSPFLGADPVGAVAVTAGVCVAAAISAGGWLTLTRVFWAALAGLAVTIGFAVLDVRRPPLERGSLGRFLSSLGDGSSGPAMARAATANGLSLLDSPLTIVAVTGVLMLAFCQFSPWGGLNRLFGLHPALRAAGAGTTVATLIAGALGGSALVVAGAAAAFAVPTAVLTTLRVLDHAADRTRPEQSDTSPVDTRDEPPERAPAADGVTVESRGWRVTRRSA